MPAKKDSPKSKPSATKAVAKPTPIDKLTNVKGGKIQFLSSQENDDCDVLPNILSTSYLFHNSLEDCYG